MADPETGTSGKRRSKGLSNNPAWSSENRTALKFPLWAVTEIPGKSEAVPDSCKLAVPLGFSVAVTIRLLVIPGDGAKGYDSFA